MKKHTHSPVGSLFVLWLVLATALHPPQTQAAVIDIGDTDDGDFIPTTTTLTVSPSSAIPGTEITLTSKTTGVTGFTISFFLDDQPIGTGVIGADGVTQLKYTVRSLTAGPHTLRATLPNANWTHKKEVARTIYYRPDGSIRSEDVFIGTVHDVIGGSSGTVSFVVADSPPIISTPPTNQIVRAGSTLILQADTVGTLPLFYQWRLNGTPLPIGTNATLTLTGVQPDQAGIYSLVASNALGTLTSSNASLTVFTVSTSLPSAENAIVKEGTAVTLTVSAASAVPVSYQWLHSGTNLPGATAPVLSLSNVQLTDGGSYTVAISDGVLSVSVDAAAFTVRPEAFSLAVARSLLDVRLQVTLNGKAGTDYTIEVSTNLAVWTVLTNSSSPSGVLLVADAEAARQPHRFYRASITASRPENIQIPNMVRIEPGTFTMGSPANEVDRSSGEDPQTRVTISRGFWMGKHEVTQGEYLGVTGSNPSNFKGDANRPVETVSWNDAINYCVKLTERERGAGRLPSGYGYRLPTEAEWEYAARAGSTTRFSYGDDPGYIKLKDYAWYSANSGNSTHPVEQKLANVWGLSDMSGNVWEWCLDWYGAYPGGSVTDPRGPATGSNRVFRGGSWDYDGRYCRSANRRFNTPDFRYSLFGFRVVLAPGQ